MNRAGHLAAGELARLAAGYRRDVAHWKAAPRAAEVRRRLDRASRALAAAAQEVGDLLPADLALAAIAPGEANDTFRRCQGLADLLLAAVGDLDARGAGNGGARRLPALFAPPPRFRLAMLLAERLDVAGVPLGSAERGPLHDRVLEVLHLAGEDGRGLPDVLREVLRARRENRAEVAPVRLCPKAAA